MSSRLLRHGALLGAFLAALALVLEILTDWPHAEEAALALRWLPVYAIVGATVGMLAAGLAALAGGPRARRRAPGILLGGSWLAFVIVGAAWLPPLLTAGHAPGLGLGVLSLGVAAGVHLLGVAAAASQRAWLFASLVAPLSAGCGLLFLAALTGLAVIALPSFEPETRADGASVTPPAQRNLVIVVLDSVRTDHLGCFGSYRATSPRLDALAEESVLFEHAYATSADHRAALAGMTHAGGAPLAADLAAAGWQTWACFDDPGQSPAPHPDPLDGFERRENARQELLPARLALARLVQGWSRHRAPPLAQRGADLVVDRALALAAGRDPERPFFLLAQLPDAAPPHEPPPALRLRFMPEGLSAADLAPGGVVQSAARLRQAEDGTAPADAREIAVLSALYDAEILAQDAALGRLVDGLTEMGLLESTLFVVVGDHGLRLGEEGGRLGAAASLHDAVLHVPLLMRLPQELPASTRAPGFVSVRELAPAARALVTGAESRTPWLVQVARQETEAPGVAIEVERDGERLLLVRAGTEAILLGPDGSVRAAGDLRADPEGAFLRARTGLTAEDAELWRQRAAALLAAASAAGRDGDALVPVGGGGRDLGGPGSGH